MPYPPVHAVLPNCQLARRAGVLSPSEAAKEPHLAWRLRMGIWRQYGDAIVMHNGPLTADQQAWVAVIAAGPGAVLAATSALVASGIRIPAPRVPHVLVPFARHPRQVPGVVVRRTRVLGRDDVDRQRQPPRLHIARAAVDASSLLTDADDVRATLCAVVQQRKATAKEIRACIMRIGPVTGRALMLRTADEIELGATSTHEQCFTRMVRRAKLPEPTRQVLRKRGNGRAYLDVVWEEYGLHVEIDGLAHLEARRWADDLDRANELELAKRECRLRFAGFLLIERESRVLDQVKRGLRQGGWPG
jgi:very-short-patch-repair endonuclease